MMRKVCIIGIGLIGGSLAKAINKSNQSEMVFGFGRDRSRLKKLTKTTLLTNIQQI